MIDYRFYRFADEAEFLAVCAQAGLDPDALPPRVDFDRIGPIERDGAPVAGWHVNAAWNEVEQPDAFEPFAVEPANPARVFAQRPVVS